MKQESALTQKNLVWDSSIKANKMSRVDYRNEIKWDKEGCDSFQDKGTKLNSTYINFPLKKGRRLKPTLIHIKIAMIMY